MDKPLSVSILSQKFALPIKVEWQFNDTPTEVEYTRKSIVGLTNIVKFMKLTQVISNDLPRALQMMRSRAKNADHKDNNVINKITVNDFMVSGIKFAIENNKYMIGYTATGTEAYWITHDLNGNRTGDKIEIEEL